MSFDRGMDKEDVLYMGYYSAIKTKVMLFAVLWMDLEIIILSKVRQRQILYDIAYM